ncbi:receptor activity-modifying protein 2-like [Scomber scombrus]|uniref:Receptor activity-modifying protein 2-like n=2 Tax=Scomber scombrus TaxID=13677 RepID=A0AAV1NVY3_SCOSC|nr:receptor activity-modifying protein 1-like [Scomber scombrus]
MVSTSYLLAFIFFWTGLSAQFIVPPCDKDKFDSDVRICLSVFNNSMKTSNYHDICPWPTVKRIYNDLKHCVDDSAIATLCRGCKFLVDEIFLEVHKEYFLLCGQVHDPPITTLIMLIAPGIIATFFLPLLCLKLTTWNKEMPCSVGL